MEVQQPAGFWIRFGASILDGLIIGIPLSLIGYLFSGDFVSEDPGGDWFMNVVSFLYALLLPIYWNGYVVGKRICGIRIIKADGSKLGIGAMVLRVLVGGLIYGLTLGIALIVSAFMVGIRKDKRGIHDLIAGTYVTHLPPQKEG
ncbi:RDD family protein [Fictibacillus sp. KIGAM418]|uniref:RDD family protein n=1 Tax=Fictibacillus marinisediminis TaxID=2878389 RepID=A0A9X1XCI9_9BACL|nr:RDD family protein [Fictibacillus marinisediminis]MCK6258367.1 RDD family protein [Fictibacillus marinisediminis]